jgi:hypothetical protein
MADTSFQTNPYALFDPSQWSNPYSQYQNSALPQPGYVGLPTNYAGQQIQPQPGMTINQTPSQPQALAALLAAQPSSSPQGRYVQTSPGGQVTGGAAGGENVASQGLTGGMNVPAQYRYMPAQQQAQAPQAAAPATTLTPQQYMALRANPGPVPTYGATVPQSASSAQPGSGVLQSFLQNWKPAQSGAGSGFQQGFAAALKNQGYS